MFKFVAVVLALTLALMIAVGNGQVSGTTTKVTQGTTPWVTQGNATVVSLPGVTILSIPPLSVGASTWEVGIYTAVNSTLTFTGNVAVSSMPAVAVSSLPSNTWDANLATHADIEALKSAITASVLNTLVTSTWFSSLATHDDMTALRTALTTSTTVTGQVRVYGVFNSSGSTAAGVSVSISDSNSVSTAGLQTRGFLFGYNATTDYFNRLQSSPTDTGALEVETGNERTLGKTQVYKVGSVTTTNATENVVTNATYTVTAGKTLFVRGWDCGCTLSTLATGTTFTNFGTASLESPTSTKIFTARLTGMWPFYQRWFNPPIPVEAGVNVRITVTPTVGTSKIWDCNLDGFEK